jgi:predicted dehydrogenase
MMPATGVVNWLLVGTGDIVRKRVAAALASGSGGRLVGVCGGLDRARAIAGQFGADEVYEQLDQALAATRAECVYVATPVYRHAEEACKALAAGKHVLIEKPLGLDGADARRIVAAADAAGRRCGCAYYRRLFPRFAHLKRLLGRGGLGKVVLVRTSYLAWFQPQSDDPKAWRVDPLKSGGGPLADMGSHTLDLIIGLFGMPRTVFAKASTLVHEYPVEDSSAVLMTLAEGAQVLASFGWSSQTWVHDFEVLGSQGGVRWSAADVGEVVLTIGRDVQRLKLPPAANVHLPLIEDFNRAVLEDRPPAVPAAEALKTNLLLDAIYESARTGQEILIEPASR